MEGTQKQNLAAARLKAAAARKELDKALAALKDGKNEHARASAAAVALGIAEADLREAECDAGLRSAPPPPRGGKMIVALVRVPACAASALRYGNGDFAPWIAEAVAVQYRSEFDPYPGEGKTAWATEVAARFGASAEDADAFGCAVAGIIDADGDAARAVAAIVERDAVTVAEAEADDATPTK